MRVIASTEKKTRLLSEQERKITAYHEMGHALVGHFLAHTDPVHKISIVSRGQALGYTIALPSEDRYLTTRSALMDDLAMTLGGRAAEALFVDESETAAPEKPKEEERKRLPKPAPRPFPSPGRALQPPPPEGASS